jgi:hypothetical protein
MHNLHHQEVQDAIHYFESKSPYLFKNGNPHEDTDLSRSFWEGFTGREYTGRRGAWHEHYFNAGQECAK